MGNSLSLMECCIDVYNGKGEQCFDGLGAQHGIVVEWLKTPDCKSGSSDTLVQI